MSGQEALQEARGPRRATVPAAAAAAAVPSPRRPAQARAPGQAVAAPGSAAQAQPRCPGTQLHGRSRRHLPSPRGSVALFGPSSGPSTPQVAAAVPGSPSRQLRAGPKDGGLRAMNGCSVGTNSRKVRPPLEAPAPHTLSVARRRAVGWGQEALGQWEWIAGRGRGRPLLFAPLLFYHLLPLLSPLLELGGAPCVIPGV